MKEEEELVSFQNISLPLTLLLLAIGGVVLVLIGKDFPLSNWTNLVQAWPQFTQGWQVHNLSLQLPFWLRLLQGIFLILAWVTLLFIAYTTLFSVLFSGAKYAAEQDNFADFIEKEHP